MPWASSFYMDGYCRVCATRQGTGHRHDCPLLALRLQVQELGGQLGVYVVTMRELLDQVDGLLRGDVLAGPGGSEGIDR